MAKHRTQELVGRLAPRAWAAAMKAKSREWIVRCRTCGAEQSIWELGASLRPRAAVGYRSAFEIDPQRGSIDGRRAPRARRIRRIPA